MDGSESTHSSSNNTELNKLSFFSYVNIRGLKPKTVQSKVELINDFLHENNKLFYAISETWLNGEKDAEVNIEGYEIFRSDKIGHIKKFGRYSGGVAIYLRKDLSSTFEKIIEFSNGAVDSLVIQSTKLKLLIACLYRQPENTKNESNPE